MAYALWARHLRHSPRNPGWLNRDRFVLSAGHGSMLLYSLLFLTGYDLSLEDLKRFRQWGSKTPGHPENHLTAGVEMATGPLGQGFATAVGMAIAERYLGHRYNRPGFDLVDHFTYVICSDGDLMEGVCQEAASLAGHLRLGKLIALYDDNRITIDGSTELAFTEDTAAKFAALGWHVQRCDGMDVDAVDACIRAAKGEPDRPSLIVARTVIGYGSPNKAGSSKSHGSALGPDEVVLTKRALGIPEEPFWVPEEALASLRGAVERGERLVADWEEAARAYTAAHPEAAREFEAVQRPIQLDWQSIVPGFAGDVSTRKASEKVLNALAPHLPTLLGGSADLAESVCTVLHEWPTFQADAPEGRNVAYGVREHAMAAAVNGANLHGGVRAYGGTFLIFSDYCRPSIRLAALMGCPSIFVFSHDSIGLGEDGPTHQPIEHLAALRAIPNLNVMRPADGYEVAACWRAALESRETPSVIVLSRQNLPTVAPPAEDGTHPAQRGAYVLREGSDAAIVATGSEVGLALHAADALSSEGLSVRVVSMPSWFLFARQPREYQASVLPTGLPTVSVEAGSTFGWSRYAQRNVGIDRFGASAPGDVLMQEFGFTVDRVAAEVRSLLGR